MEMGLHVVIIKAVPQVFINISIYTKLLEPMEVLFKRKIIIQKSKQKYLSIKRFIPIWLTRNYVMKI